MPGYDEGVAGPIGDDSLIKRDGAVEAFLADVTLRIRLDQDVKRRHEGVLQTDRRGLM